MRCAWLLWILTFVRMTEWGVAEWDDDGGEWGGCRFRERTA